MKLPNVTYIKTVHAQFSGYIFTNANCDSILSGDIHLLSVFLFCWNNLYSYFHYNDRELLLTFNVDQICSFLPYFTGHRTPDGVEKILHVLKTFVEGGSYQIGWILHGYNQRLAVFYKKSSEINVVTDETIKDIEVSETSTSEASETNEASETSETSDSEARKPSNSEVSKDTEYWDDIVAREDWDNTVENDQMRELLDSLPDTEEFPSVLVESKA